MDERAERRPASGLAPVRRAVVADVRPEDVPEALPGALPENSGRDPADTHRDD